MRNTMERDPGVDRGVEAASQRRGDLITGRLGVIASVTLTVGATRGST
jgi:hypothetical protein